MDIVYLADGSIDRSGLSIYCIIDQPCHSIGISIERLNDRSINHLIDELVLYTNHDQIDYLIYRLNNQSDHLID